MRTFKETSKIVEEVANIALQAAEEKGLTFRETMTGKKETAPKEPGTVVTVTFDTEEFEKGLQGVIEQIEAKFGPAEDEAEQEQEATEQEQEATEQEQENTEQEQENTEKEPPEVTAESILEAAEEATCRG